MKLKEKFNKKYESVFKKLEEYRRQAIENKVPNKSLIDVQNFKVSIQGIMIFAVVESFKTNYHQIMSGEFDGDLLSTSSANEIADDLRNLAFKYVFSNKEVLTLELVGDRVISDLLSLFIEAVTNVNGLEKSKSKHEKLVHLISENFRHIQRFSEAGKPEVDFSELTLYNRLLLVTDFISGMTDGYAVNLHQELLGVKLP